MSENEPPHKRRVRYKGKHPRRFEEKYKEHNPEKYAEDLKKVIESGKTPAGMHRSIMVTEVLEALTLSPGDVGLDATLGYGGHSSELLRRILPGGKLFGIDVDPIEIERTEERLRKLGHDENELVIRRLNFAGIPKLMAETDGGFDFILADLGVSSMQLDNPERGFTYKTEGPLDLRLNPGRGQPASALLKSISQIALAKALTRNSDEPHAARIAEALHKSRDETRTTTALAKVVRKALVARFPKMKEEDIVRSIRRTFQALRIEVNDEFSALDQFLRNLEFVLKPSGRVAILSFHSGEDKRVSRFLQTGLHVDFLSRLARRP